MAIGTPTLLKEYTINSTGQSSIGLTLPAGASAAAGDLVVVCYGFGKGSTPTITCADTQSNTYQLDVQADKTTNQTPHSGIFSSVLDTALSEGDTITVSFSASVNYPLAGAYVVTGIVASSWKDQASSGTGQSTSPSSGNVTTTQADELLVGVTVTGVPQTLSYGSGWTRLGTHVLNTTKAQDVGYAIKSSTGTYVFDGSITSADWASCVATYKAAAGDVTAEPDQGAATAAGQTPTVVATPTPDQGAATAAGQTPTAAHVATPDQAGSTAAGQTPTVAVVATPDQGAATADGYAPTISTGGGDVVAEPDQGAATADGNAPTPAVTATPSQGAATADGLVPTVAIVATPSPGEATADGMDATVVTPITATPDVGEATADGYPPTIVVGGQAAAGILVSPAQARQLAQLYALELDDEETVTVLAVALAS